MDYIPVPKAFDEIQLTEEQRKHLIYMDEEMMVWGDKRCYDVLRESKELYLDGTYKVTPLNLYKQLYTIHCKANGVIFPVIYALMKYKKNESYEKLFNIVEHEVGKPIFHEPKTVLGDFEIVNIHCFSKDVVKKASFFHYTQNIYRRAQKIGAVEYGKRGSFHSLCKSLMVLPLIPVKRIMKAFKYIKSKYRTRLERK